MFCCRRGTAQVVRGERDEVVSGCGDRTTGVLSIVNCFQFPPKRLGCHILGFRDHVMIREREIE